MVWWATVTGQTFGIPPEVILQILALKNIFVNFVILITVDLNHSYEGFNNYR